MTQKTQRILRMVWDFLCLLLQWGSTHRRTTEEKTAEEEKGGAA